MVLAFDLAALTQVQIFRVVGGVFLPMLIGNLPPVFALPAGLGDVASDWPHL